jgi:hypothetical protein
MNANPLTSLPGAVGAHRRRRERGPAHQAMPEAIGYHAHVHFDADTIERARRTCTACGTNSA